jgi:hypothetical protein
MFWWVFGANKGVVRGFFRLLNKFHFVVEFED